MDQKEIQAIQDFMDALSSIPDGQLAKMPIGQIERIVGEDILSRLI